MSDKRSTVEGLWQEYAAAVGVPMGGVQWQETRRAFYAGVIVILASLRHGVPDDEDEGVAWLQSLEDEGKAFMGRLAAGKA